MTHYVDLSLLLDEMPHATSLTGRDAGERGRVFFDLDRLDRQQDDVRVTVPRQILSLTSSFITGMFGPSVCFFGDEEKFLDRYRFNADTTIMRQIIRGAARALHEAEDVRNEAA